MIRKTLAILFTIILWTGSSLAGDRVTLIDLGSPSGSGSDPTFTTGATIPSWSLPTGTTLRTVASATTPDLGNATSEYVEISGVVTITGFASARIGTIKFVRFTGALVLTYNGTSFILPGARPITTEANDRATFISLGAGNWLCHEFLKASGLATGMIAESVVASTIGMTNPQAFGGVLNNYGQAGNVIVTVPALAKGMNFTLSLGTTAAFYYRITLGAGDIAYLDGVAGSAAGSIQVVSAVAGNQLQCQTAQTGASSYALFCDTISGAWAAL